MAIARGSSRWTPWSRAVGQFLRHLHLSFSCTFPSLPVFSFLFPPSCCFLSNLFSNGASKSSYLSIDGSNFPNQLQMLVNRDGLWLPREKSVSLHEIGRKLYVDLMVCTKKFIHSKEGRIFLCSSEKVWTDSRDMHGGGGGSWGKRVDFFYAAISCQLRNI